MDGLKSIFSKTPTFLIAYILIMLVTYVLPYMGSNSVVMQSVAAGSGAPEAGTIHMAFLFHLAAMVALCVIAWARGAGAGKGWIVVFPIIAAVFDLTPGLSLIPLIPTAMHIGALIMGARAMPPAAAGA
jgi:hypothetical protein